jgi:hypothetical protein
LLNKAISRILASPMLCQVSYAVRSVWVCDISELSLVPSISMQSSNHDFFLCWFYVLRWIWCLWCYSECISTPGKLEKYVWPRWESNLRLAQCSANNIVCSQKRLTVGDISISSFCVPVFRWHDDWTWWCFALDFKTMLYTYEV